MEQNKRKKGFTILELLITMFVLSLIFVSVAAGISKMGEVSTYSYTDISTRSSQNKLFNELNIAVHSLVSNKDTDYAAITSGGVVVENIQSEEEVEINGKTYRSVKANKVTLYTKGDIQKRVLSITPDNIQERAPIFLTGTLYDGSFRFDYDASGNIIGEHVKEEVNIPCVTFSSIGEENYESGFELILDGDILQQITFNFILPKYDYQTKQTTITQTCQQEVKVICLP